MKIPSDKLFRLIKSLSKTEKGYFLKSAGRSKDEYRQYVKLFLAMDSLQTYDESQVRILMKDDACVRQLHVAKNYLYKILLKSLYLFNAENSATYKISEAMGNISLLYGKGLYSECQKEIRKAKVLAYKTDKYENILEILRWERLLILRTSSAPIPGTLIEEEIKAADIIRNLVQYRKLYYGILSLIRERGSIRNVEERELFLMIINDPLMADIESALCIEAKILFFEIKIVYSEAESDDEASFENASKLVNFMDSHPEIINDFIKDYVTATVQKLTSAFNMGKFDIAHNISAELRSKKIRSVEQKEYIFYTTYLIELFIYIVNCEFEKGLQIIPQIRYELKNISSDDSNAARFILFKNIFYIYFALEDYSTSLIWLNKILNANLHNRPDIYSLMHILNLIVHYELKNVDLIHHSVINTYRYLYKRKKIFRFESEVLKFIRRISNIADTDQLRDEFIVLKSGLMKLMDDPYERVPLQYFDFISWLDSKISGKSFIEMKKRNKNS